VIVDEGRRRRGEEAKAQRLLSSSPFHLFASSSVALNCATDFT
jgi:hypothetical protein